MGKYPGKLKNAGLNIVATGFALVSSGLAISNGAYFGAAFPLSVAYITTRAAYNDWNAEGLPPKEAIPYIKMGLTESAHAKIPIALAGAVSACGEILPPEALVPSVVIPLTISGIKDSLTVRKLKKLEEMLN